MSDLLLVLKYMMLGIVNLIPYAVLSIVPAIVLTKKIMDDIIDDN